MRSPYEELVAGISSDNNNNNNNNNTNLLLSVPLDSSNSSSINSSSAIPYHARENSLPFSYGQITTQKSPLTSTPLRNRGYNNSYNNNNYNNTHSNNNNNYNRNYEYDSGFYKSNNNGFEKTTSEMIKPQPRLTSPLLVRKTLNNSRSPTTATNTIANTYHYNYNNNNNNNNINNNNNNNKDTTDFLTRNGSYLDSGINNNNNNSNNNNEYHHQHQHHQYNKTTTTTPRNYDEFEELLRERRAKVFHEYGQRTTSSSGYEQTTKSTTSTNTPLRKFNYDFEFKLNLNDKNDEEEEEKIVNVAPTPPRRAYTMDRLQLQPRINYNNNHIINNNNNNHMNNNNLDNVERNYHTISATHTTSHLQRPPLELNVGYKRHFDILQQQQQQQQQHQSELRPSTAIYGNGNVAGSQNWLQDLSSPIYATSSKQRTNTTTTRQHDTEFTTISSRPETPAFPVTPRMPYGQQTDTLYQTLARPRLNSALSLSNSEPQEVAPHLVKFAIGQQCNSNINISSNNNFC